MQIAEFPNAGAAADGPVLRRISKTERALTSGPGLRAFRAIADRWGLGERERIAVLGDPGRSTYHQWMKKAQDGAAVTLPLDTLLRISAILGIHKALAILFEDEGQAMTWMKGPHEGTLFRGAAPMEFILAGGHDGIMSVRRYLDAWRGGAAGLGAGSGDFEPVGEDDIVLA